MALYGKFSVISNYVLGKSRVENLKQLMKSFFHCLSIMTRFFISKFLRVFMFIVYFKYNEEEMEYTVLILLSYAIR